MNIQRLRDEDWTPELCAASTTTELTEAKRTLAIRCPSSPWPALQQAYDNMTADWRRRGE